MVSLPYYQPFYFLGGILFNIIIDRNRIISRIKGIGFLRGQDYEMD